MGRNEDDLDRVIFFWGVDTKAKEAAGTPEGPDLIMGRQSGIGIAVEEVLNQEVDHSGGHIESLLMVGENPELFRHFVWLAKRINLDLILHTDANSTVRLFRPDLDLDIGLVIPEIGTFVQEMEGLYCLFEERYLSHVNSPEEKRKYEFEMPKHERFFDILLDATPSDWQSLGDFFFRRRQELVNGPIIEWGSTRELAGGKMTMTSSTSGEGMEGYFQFSSSYLIGHERAALSDLRYGRVSNSEAVIYSVQNPKIDGQSSKSAETNLWVLAQVKILIENICRGLSTPPPFFIDGAINDEELLKFYEIGRKAADPKLTAFGMNLDENTLVFEYVARLRKKPTFETAVEKFKVNQKAVRAINKALRRGLSNKLGSFKNVPGQAFLALLGAIKILHKSGIRKIRIPMKLPLRIHPRQQEIDEHIYNGKLSLVKRLVFELEGVTANTEDCAFNAYPVLTEKDGGSGVDYLVVELADIITPKREVVQEIWKDS